MAGAVPAAAQFSDAYNFLKAVDDKDGAKVTELLNKPGNALIDARDSTTGDTALHKVVKKSDATWTGFLLQRGANPNSRDKDGSTPLIVASIARFTEGVRYLVQFKAQTDLQNRLGETALLKAVQNRDTVIAKMLIDAGANPDIADNSGLTARAAATNDPRNEAIAKMLKDVPVRQARAVQGPR
jgi:ankyrin repeat protein